MSAKITAEALVAALERAGSWWTFEIWQDPEEYTGSKEGVELSGTFNPEAAVDILNAALASPTTRTGQ